MPCLVTEESESPQFISIPQVDEVRGKKPKTKTYSSCHLLQILEGCKNISEQLQMPPHVFMHCHILSCTVCLLRASSTASPHLPPPDLLKKPKYTTLMSPTRNNNSFPWLLQMLIALNMFKIVKQSQCTFLLLRFVLFCQVGQRKRLPLSLPPPREQNQVSWKEGYE